MEPNYNLPRSFECRQALGHRALTRASWVSEFQTPDGDDVWTGFRRENYVALGHHLLRVVDDATAHTGWLVDLWHRICLSEAAFPWTRVSCIGLVSVSLISSNTPAVADCVQTEEKERFYLHAPPRGVGFDTLHLLMETSANCNCTIMAFIL